MYQESMQYMASQGNPGQWVAVPPVAEWQEQISREHFWLIDHAGSVIGCFILQLGDDPTYAYIEGEWPDNLPYATLHRVISDASYPRLFDQICAFSFGRHERVRIDTHAQNKTMTKAILRNGFTYAGTIYLENGDARDAYYGDRESFINNFHQSI